MTMQTGPDEPRPRRRLLSPAHALLALPVVLLGYCASPLPGYIDWATLDVPTLNRKIDEHMRSHHGDVAYACLYTVNCEGEHASLDLRTRLTPADMERIKQDVWRRRFDEAYCSGQTSNFAIGHAGAASQYPPGDCYSFGEGFGGASGIMSGCGFGDIRAIPCTRAEAWWTREDGIIAGR